MKRLALIYSQKAPKLTIALLQYYTGGSLRGQKADLMINQLMMEDINQCLSMQLI